MDRTEDQSGKRSGLWFLILIVLVAGSAASCSRDNNAGAEQSGVSTEPRSIHQAHLSHFDSLGIHAEEEWDSLHGIVHTGREPVRRNPEFKVFGWHPYYMGSSYRDYNYGILWGISYFCYQVDPTTGSYSDIHDWRTTPMVDLARAAGTRVFLTAANFGTHNNTTFLNSRHAQQRFIDSISVLLGARNADGVTIDFENVPESHRDAFVSFIQGLSDSLRSHNPDIMITMTLPGIIKDRAFNIPALSPHVDLFMVMGYDYHYSGSPQAGPVAPLASSRAGDGNNLETSVDAYLAEGLPKEKLMLSLPYYGREWKTRNASIPSANVRSLGTRLYRSIRDDVNIAAATFDPGSSTKYTISDTLEGTAQLWFDDAETLGAKYDWVKKKGLAGIGIWALGYDNGHTGLWEVLEEKFGQ